MSDFQKPIRNELFQKFVSSIRILLIKSRIFGLVTFTPDQSNFRPSNRRIFFNIVFIFIYLPIILYCIYITAFSEDLYMIYKTTNIIILGLNVVYVVTSLICAITKRDMFVEFLLKLVDFDTKIQTMNIKVNYNKIHRKIMIPCLVRIGVLTVIISTLAIMANLNGDEMIVESMAYILLVMNSAVCHQSIELVKMLKIRFVILNKQINNLIDYFQKNKISTVEMKSTNKQLNTLNKICALHHHLSKMIKLFNDTFGIVLLLMFGVSFVVIVIMTFFFTGIIQAGELYFMTLLNPILSTITFIIDVVFVCDVSYSTIEEANKAGELIHKIETEDHDIRDEIEMFSLQIANEQVEFNAAGFFPINYTLVFSILGGVTTYIIILIQLAASLAE
ncbi:putative gustatory receptor 28b [Tribolium madens]|uniref:putative gustatory receptor 28b n=1 Tax=Tribolium madens TaxID=41895 RepID=UPI001CF721AD|nr:putative gustatory receptor 28b [Tribolium madens]